MKSVVLSVDLVNKLLAYIEKRPWIEVRTLMQQLVNEIENNLPSKETDDEDCSRQATD